MAKLRASTRWADRVVCRMCGCALLLALLGFTPGQAQVDIHFWHSMQASAEQVAAFAEAFNQSQDAYRVQAHYVGNYQESQTRFVAALGTAEQPSLYQAEIAFFPQLVQDGVLEPLDAWVETLEPSFIEDFFPGLWQYGELAGQRYGLPWNSSTPVLLYNATAFRQRGVEAPQTWEDFVEASARLSSRRSQGFIAMAESWIFEAMVTTRGGSLVTASGAPNFDSPEAIAALQMLQDLVQRGHASARSYAELPFAQLDMVRTQGMMIFASIANWPEARRFSFAFELAAAPMPTGGAAAVPLGGAQLVIPNTVSEAEQQGAFAFWQFLMEAENVAAWVRDSFYIPVRRAALPLLEPWYDEDPNRRAALAQLEQAVPRPRVAAFASWRRYLEDAIEQVIKAGVDPETALQDAQQRALALP